MRLADGAVLEAEAFFVSSPAKGRTDLAVAMGTGNISAVMIDQHLRKQDVS